MAQTGGMIIGPIAMHAAAMATGNGTVIKPQQPSSGGYTVFAAQVTGINGDTITWEATIDDTNWVSILVENLTSGTSAATATANGLYRTTAIGLRQIRARISTYGSGTIYVTGYLVA